MGYFIDEYADADPPIVGSHNVTFLVEDETTSYQVTQNLVDFEGVGGSSREDAIARAAARTSKDLRLVDPNDLHFKSYSWSPVG